MDIDALIARQKAALDNVKPVDQDVLLGDEAVTVRLWPLTGPAWRDLVATHPWREGAQFDQQLGYNLDGVVRDYPKVYLVVDGEPVNVTDRWADLFEVLSGADIKNLGFAVWGLNEFDPADRLVKAGKASAGGRRKKQNSPAN